MSLVTEEECTRRIMLAMRGLQDQCDKLREELKIAKFRACVAEWAVAGVAVAQSNLHINTGAAQYEMALDPMAMVAHFGKRVGAELLARAHLAFKDHAKLCELRMRANGVDANPRSYALDHVPDSFTWPRPFPEMQP